MSKNKNGNDRPKSIGDRNIRQATADDRTETASRGNGEGGEATFSSPEGDTLIGRARVSASETQADNPNTGSGAGGGDEGESYNTGIVTGEPQLGRVARASEARLRANERPTDIADRAALRAAELDRVYTVESKDRWGSDQPDFSDLLAESRETDKKQREAQDG